MSSSTMRLVAALAIAAVSAKYQGPITIKEDGKTLDLHLSAPDDFITTSGDVVSMTWGGQVRGFTTKTKSDHMHLDNYYSFTLFNKELSYMADLSQVGCSCNAAMFFVTLPGYDKNDQIARGELNPWYCDANDIGGVWCWEYDSMEANKHAMHVTPHTCNAQPGTYITSCDGVGSSSSLVDTDAKSMCPHDSCVIDTRRPFRVIQRFEGDATGEKLVKVTHKMVQGNRAFEMDVSYKKYWEKMTSSFKGNMTMTFQLWGSTWDKMTWLDGQLDICSATDCDKEAVAAAYWDIQINTIKPDSWTTIFM